MPKLDIPVYWFPDRASLVFELNQRLRSDDVILLKGSKSHELWKVLEELPS